jgi:predicted ATP-binding protein involved in virulence
MKITKISVVDLFDTYTYTIDLRQEKFVSIIHAPNGYGKTTVFKLIRDVFNLNINELYEIPFRSFSIDLDDGHSISLIKSNSEKDIIDQDSIKTRIKITLNRKTENSFIFDGRIIKSLKDFIRHQRSPFIQKAPLDDEDVINVINQMIDFKKKIEIHFIETNRLYGNYNSEYNLIDIKNAYDTLSETGFRRRGPNASIELNERINRYAFDLKRKIDQVKQEYSSFSESLDRTFPNRLVRSVNSKKEFYDERIIGEKLKELESKRTDLEKIGFISKEINNTSLPSLNDSDATLKRFYTLYIDDTFSKLNHYNNIKEKIELFFDIINSKTSFSNKELLINSDGFVYFVPRVKNKNINREIELQNLSSGEKHDFILFYELIFNSDEKSIFLIDEPEISLHVAWQVEYIKILEEICKMNGIQAIVATHSPDIVNGRDDLLISLGLEDDEDEK